MINNSIIKTPDEQYFSKRNPTDIVQNSEEKQLLYLLNSSINTDNIVNKDVYALVGEIMTRKEIEARYAKKIKQLNMNNPDPLLDHRWYIYLDGKKVKKQTRDEIIQWLIEYENKPKEKELTLIDIFESWKSVRRLECSSGTFRIDIRYWKTYIKTSSLAAKPLTEIDVDDGGKFFTHCKSLNPTIKEKYFKNVNGTLNSLLNYAVEKHFIPSNPLSVISINRDLFTPKSNKSDNEQIYTDKEKSEMKELAFKLAKETCEPKYLAPILLFNLGIRDGELLGLKWKDIDLTEKKIQIQSEIIEDVDENGNFKGYKFVDHCKTEASNRLLDINSELRKALLLIKELNLSNGFSNSNDDFVLQRRRKGIVTFCTPRTIYTMIEKMCKEIGMSIIKSPHDMRRTFATNLAYKNVPIKEISRMMGHSNTKQTEAYIKSKADINTAAIMELVI